MLARTHKHPGTCYPSDTNIEAKPRIINKNKINRGYLQTVLHLSYGPNDERFRTYSVSMNCHNCKNLQNRINWKDVRNTYLLHILKLSKSERKSVE